MPDPAIETTEEKIAPARTQAPWWAWYVCFGLVCMTVMVVGSVGLFAYMSSPPGGGPQKPGVDSVLLAKAQQAIGDNESGVADDYLRGMFLGVESLLGVDSFSNRQTFHRYLSNLAEGWKYATDLPLQPGELLADPYDWMAEGGDLTSDDKRKLQHSTRAVIFALEAAGK